MTNLKAMSMPAWKLNQISKIDLQNIAIKMIEEFIAISDKKPLGSRLFKKIFRVRSGIADKATIIKAVHGLAPRLVLNEIRNQRLVTQ